MSDTHPDHLYTTNPGMGHTKPAPTVRFLTFEELKKQHTKIIRILQKQGTNGYTPYELVVAASPALTSNEPVGVDSHTMEKFLLWAQNTHQTVTTSPSDPKRWATTGHKP